MKSIEFKIGTDGNEEPGITPEFISVVKIKEKNQPESNDEESRHFSSAHESDYEPPAKTKTPKASVVKPKRPMGRPSKRGRKGERTDDVAENELIKKHVKLICAKCPELPPFELFRELANHMKKKHYSHKVVTCCKKSFQYRIALARHLTQKHEDSFHCEQCGQGFKKLTTLKRHQVLEHEAICNICGENLGTNNDHNYTKKKLWYHAQQHALSTDHGKLAPFICDHCGAQEKNYSAIVKHINVVHLAKLKTIVCEDCGAQFTLKANYDKHKSTHSGEVGKVPCEICHYLIKDNADAMKAHIKNIHRAKPTPCPICGEVLKSEKGMRRHIKRRHSEIKRHGCSICDKRFNTPKRLKEHIAVHQGVSLYFCSFCSAEFKSSGNLSAHKRRLHPVEYEAEKAENISKKYVSAS